MELLASICILIFIALIYGVVVKSFIKHGKLIDVRLSIIVLGVYLLSFIYLVFMPLQINLDEYRMINTISSINYYPVITLDIKSFLLNIMLFTPLGIFLYLLGLRKLKKVIIATVLISLSVELMQFSGGLVLGNLRSVDVNDLIANTAGGILGFILIRHSSRYSVISRHLNKFLLRKPS